MNNIYLCPVCMKETIHVQKMSGFVCSECHTINDVSNDRNMDNEFYLKAKKLIVVQKIRDFIADTGGSHMNGIHKGTIRKGEFHKKPVVDEAYVVDTPSRYFTTSRVVEIVEDHETHGIFKTLNSTYSWKIISDEQSQSDYVKG